MAPLAVVVDRPGRLTYPTARLRLTRRGPPLWLLLGLLLAMATLAAELTPEAPPAPAAPPITTTTLRTESLVARQLVELRNQVLGPGVKADDLDRAARDLPGLQAGTRQRATDLQTELTAAQQRLDDLPAPAPIDATAGVAAHVAAAGAGAVRLSAAARLLEVKGYLRLNRQNFAQLRDLAEELENQRLHLAFIAALRALFRRPGAGQATVAGLSRDVTVLTLLCVQMRARVDVLDAQLSTARESLQALVPELAPAPAAKAVPETTPAKALPESAATAALALDAAVPLSPAEPAPALAAALVGQAQEVVDEATRLDAEQMRLVRWRGEYRVLLLRAERQLVQTRSDMRQRAAVELLQRGPLLSWAVRDSLAHSEQWTLFYRRLVEGSAVPQMGRNPRMLAGAVGLLLFCCVAGWWARRRLRALAARTAATGFAGRLACSWLAVSAHHAMAVFVLGGAAAFFSTVGAPADKAPFLALLADALLLFVGLRILSRTFLAPFPPATSFTPLTREVEVSIARRLTMLALVGVLSLLLFRTLGDFALPTNPFLVVRAFTVALLTVNLGWLLWLFGQLPRVRAFGVLFRATSLAFLSIATAAELAGYRDLSTYLLRGVLGTCLLSPALWVTQRLLDEVFDSVHDGRRAWVRGLRDRLGLAPDQPLPGMGWLRLLVGVVYWAGACLAMLRLWATDTGYASALAVLDRGVTIGSVHIVPSRLLVAVTLFTTVLCLSAWIESVLRRSLAHQHRLDPGAREAVATMAGYAGFVVATLGLLNALGVSLAALAVVAGALSVGIGFGLQGVVNNFVSGLILLFERPIQVGDWIETGETHGIVTNISVRSTEIRTFDRAEVVIPNAELLSHPLLNRTRYNPVGRVTVKLDVAYGTDVAAVRQLLLDLAAAHPLVLSVDDLAPSVVFLGFGERSLKLELRCMVSDVLQAEGTHSDLNLAIVEAFAAHGVEIPFAKRDLELTQLAEALRQWLAEHGRDAA